MSVHRPVRYDNGLPREMRLGQEYIDPQYLGSGTPDNTKYLRGDGTWQVPPGGGSIVVTAFEQNVSATPVHRGKFIIADAGISATTKITIWQQFAALTGKGTRADENEMDFLDVQAEAGDGQMTVYWQTKPMIIISPVLPDGNTVRNSASSLVPPQDNPQVKFISKRIGKVKGNFKFCYSIAG